jgi:hypothetical protein
MAQLFTNNAVSTLASAIGTTDTTVFIAPGQGGRFPVVVAPNFCFATLENATGDIEVVRITAHSAASTSLTVTRAQQGTTALSWAIGDLFEVRPTAAEATAWESDIDALESSRALKAGDTYTGTHNFSGATAVSFPANTVIGTVSAVELGYLDGVTSSLQVQLDGKGSITGQTWTGVHAFAPTVSIGNVSATEIGYLDGVGGPIQVQLDGKADVSGEPSYSGTHDFTSATVNVATALVGQSGSRAASLDFVIATVLSGTLPGQAGNAGKFLTTDGTNASFQSLPTIPISGGGTGATSASAARTALGVPSLAGDTFSGPVVVPAGASGSQVPRASEVRGLASLTPTLVSGTTVTVVAGQHVILTNAATSTATSPAAATAGDRWRVTVANGRADNSINWNGLKHENSSEATTVIDDAAESREFEYISAGFGWKVLR